MEDTLSLFFKTHGLLPAKPCPHHCTPECSLWRQPKTDNYVCRRTYTIHVCGPSCDHAVPSPHNEGLVCTLTGIVIGTVFPVIMSPSSFGSGVNCVSSTLIRKTRGVSRRDNTALKRAVDDALFLVYRSKARQLLQEKKGLRLRRYIKRELRRGKTHDVISAALFQKEVAYIASFQDSPAVAETLRKVSKLIVDYWGKFDLRPIRKVIFAFVGSILTLVRLGKTVQGVQIFPVIQELYTLHPEEADFGPLLSISCRNITKMTKTILRASIHGEGVPRPEFIFSEAGRRQRKQTAAAKQGSSFPGSWKAQTQQLALSGTCSPGARFCPLEADN